MFVLILIDNIVQRTKLWNYNLLVSLSMIFLVAIIQFFLRTLKNPTFFLGVQNVFLKQKEKKNPTFYKIKKKSWKNKKKFQVHIWFPHSHVVSDWIYMVISIGNLTRIETTPWLVLVAFWWRGSYLAMPSKSKAFCLLSFSNGGSIKRDDKEIFGEGGGGGVCLSSWIRMISLFLPISSSPHHKRCQKWWGQKKFESEWVRVHIIWTSKFS